MLGLAQPRQGLSLAARPSDARQLSACVLQVQGLGSVLAAAVTLRTCWSGSCICCSEMLVKIQPEQQLLV